MDIVNLAIALLEVIDLIAATGVGIPTCQRGAASLREQKVQRGYTHQFYRGPKSDHVYRGTGITYRNGTTGSYLTCAGMCLQDGACKSFNFCKDKKRCELNSAVYLQNESDLQFASGCIYFDEEYHESEAEECSGPIPLGLEDGTIPDERMTSSSFFSATFSAYTGRLNNMDSYWEPASNMHSDSWIEVDLGEPKYLFGVTTQGAPWGEWRVMKYSVSFKKDHPSTFEHVTDDNGDIKVFDGNVDDIHTPVTNMFNQSVIAVAVRVEPVEWFGGVAMRLEVLGC